MAIQNSASRRAYEVQKCFLEDIQAFWIANIYVQYVPFDCCRRKKGILKEIMLYFEYLITFLVLYVLTEVRIILNRYFWHLYLKTLKKHHSFLYHLLFSRVSKPSPTYSFPLDVSLIAPAIANDALYWIESSFWWNEALYAWS